MNLNQSIVKTPEYQILSKNYPNITESIKLEREMKRLNIKLISNKGKSTQFKIKREIAIIKRKLRKNKLLKRLHGESKQEEIFRKTMKPELSNNIITSLSKKFFVTRITNFRKKIRENLPPTIFSLRELDASEKGLELSEWILKTRRKKS
jgi:hypothetical protein